MIKTFSGTMSCPSDMEDIEAGKRACRGGVSAIIRRELMDNGAIVFEETVKDGELVVTGTLTIDVPEAKS